MINIINEYKRAKIFLSDGYGGLSLKAIRNINPFLSKGYSLALSVILGGVKNAFGKEKWAKYVSEHEKIENYIKHLMKGKNAEGELIEKIKVFLRILENFVNDFFNCVFTI